MAKLLLVDDNVDILELLSDLLTELGFDVITARSGEAALLRVEKQDPDLILLDIDMPGISGIEVCRQLKANHETSAIPVIILSGTIEDNLWKDAQNAGCDRLISKPPDVEELETTIQDLLP